jgi:signal transduction histidine kinase
VLAAAAGLVTAAVVFAAVGAGLIRAQSEVVARAELDRQAEQLAKLISTQAERALTRGTQVPSFEPTSIEALVGENTKLYYTGLALTPGSEQPTSEIPAVVAGAIDYEVLERKGVQRLDFTQPGQSVVSEASAAPVTIGGEQFGAILLARPPGELASAWPDVAGRVVGAAGIGLGVALLLSLLLTSRVTRPLTAMQAATHRVARGDLRTELSSTGTQELDELAADFNRMVRQIAERDGASREFLMRVTHDLRTPLTAIRGHAAALSDGVVPPDDVPRSLAAIEGEAARLETLVADLLDLARLDAHRFKLDLSRVEPTEVLDLAFDAMEAEAVVRGLAYERRIEELPPVITDEARVRQIMTNLLDNAIHWTPRGGTVRLEGRSRAGGGFVAAVTDTGPGIPDAELEHIFDPFQSLETPDGRRGSGLGLAISRQLARALGGEVRAESREGAGSRFILELPGQAAEGVPASAGP